MGEWKTIDTSPEEVWNFNPVDLWLNIPAMPSTMGISDSFRVVDCHKKDGSGDWCHYYNGKETPLRAEFITHWMRRPDAPTNSKEGI